MTGRATSVTAAQQKSTQSSGESGTGSRDPSKVAADREASWETYDKAQDSAFASGDISQLDTLRHLLYGRYYEGYDKTTGTSTALDTDGWRVPLSLYKEHGRLHNLRRPILLPPRSVAPSESETIHARTDEYFNSDAADFDKYTGLAKSITGWRALKGFHEALGHYNG